MSRLRRALATGGAAAAVTAVGATTALVRERNRRLARLERTNPSGPRWAQLPEGQSMVVATEDGVHLAVLVAGPPDAPTVVLSHCWTGNRRMWATVARRLVLGGHRVVLYDQRGHGQSSCPETPPTVAQLGHDLRAVLDAVGVERAVFAGHSMGGMSIQSYAAEHPEHFAARAEGLVLVATAARVLGRAIPARVAHQLLGDGRSEWSRRGRVGHRMARRALGAQARPDHVALTLESLAATPGVVRSGFLLAMAGMDLRHGNRAIAVPTTILVGTRDVLTPPRLGRQLAASIEGSKLVVLPGAGHMLPLERPDHIIDAIRATAHQRDALLPVDTT
jgi:pimeloyl-ACP methyl ester carboxylesterase